MVESAKSSAVECGRPALDALDMRIIRLLQERPRAPYSELARLASIPESTLRRRAEHLFSSGVIASAVIPDVAELGFAAWTVVGLNVDLNQLDAIVSQLRVYDQVTMVLVTLGRYDILIGIAARSAPEVHRFIVDKVAPLPGVRASESFITADVVKIMRDWRIPLPDSN